MKALLSIAWVLAFAIGAMIMTAMEGLISFLLLRVDWTLVFVIGFSALILRTFLKKRKTHKDNG